MDVTDLQRRLRNFAAARDWQPFHTPKNLAMALMVEAAELQELFQWLTPEESRQIAADPQRKEALADELADVLLYLLQLADHTGVDLHEAVERKLVKNGLKHRAKHPEVELPAPAKVEPLASRGHLLIDWENVQPKCEDLRAQAPEGTDVWIFHGPHQKLDTEAFERTYGRERVTRIPRTGVGKNALDFQLSYYIGYISARQPQACFVVVSNDTGYDPMLAHARELGFSSRRCAVYRQPVRPVTQATAPATEVAKTPALSAPITQSSTAPAVTAVSAPVASAAPKPAKITAPSPAKAPATKGASSKVSAAEMKSLSAKLLSGSQATRPARRESLLNWLQAHFQAPNAQAPRVLHALAQLQSQKLVVIKGDEVSYPTTLVAKPAHPSKSKAPAGAPKAQPSAQKETVPKVHTRTPAQMALSVLASLRKMSANKPARRAGLLKLIETHTATAADPQAMAQRVLTLLEVRQDVVVPASGTGLTYPRLAKAVAVMTES